MKRKLDYVVTASTQAVTLAASRRTRTEKRNRVGRSLVGPASFGGLGDQAFMLGALETEARVNSESYGVVPGDAEPWRAIDADREFVSMAAFHRGRFPVLTETGRAWARSNSIAVLGVDTVSGTYGHFSLAQRYEALNLSAANGHRSQLVNFSVSDDITPLAIRMLESLHSDVELWVRDSLSRDRLEALAGIGDRVRVCPDVGIFLRAKDTDRSRRLEEDLGQGFITYVPNAHLAQLGWYSREDVVNIGAQHLRLLREIGPVVVVPHDLRKKPGDVSLAAEILETSGIRGNIFVPSSAAEAKAVIARSRFCLSARMHAAIAALSSGVECVGLEYLNKFEGQFAHFGKSDAIVQLEDFGDLAKVRCAIDSELAAVTGAIQPDYTSIGWSRLLGS